MNERYQLNKELAQMLKGGGVIMDVTTPEQAHIAEEAGACAAGGEPCFGTMDITLKRNAYGRQLGSFRCTESFDGKSVEMPFIRALFVSDAGSAKVLAVHENRIVAVKQGAQLACAFHPELTDDSTVYDMFLKDCKGE